MRQHQELGCPSFPHMNSPHTHKQTNSAGQASPPLPVRVVLDVSLNAAS